MNEQDRELLEQASEAAGYWQVNGWSTETHKGMRWVDDDGCFERYWNPLKNNAEAFSLLVKLRLIAGVHENYSSCAGYSPVGDELHEEHEDDIEAATRRVIVRAAAEMFKGMK